MVHHARFGLAYDWTTNNQMTKFLTTIRSLHIMKIKIMSIVALLLIAGMVVVQASAADKPQLKNKNPKKISGAPVRTYLNINNVSTVFKNDGISDIDAQESNSGFVFPKGSRKTAVFQSGFLWGGIVRGDTAQPLRVGGSAYRTGLQPGKILSDGSPEDPELAKNRIYRVRADVSPYEDLKDKVSDNFSTEVSEEGGSAASVRAQYETDWDEWPATDGAPYTDVNENGIYEPSIDKPGFPGADQTIWYVCNDLNSGLTTNLYGSNPMGIELQVTAWAYNQSGALGNMLFRKYLMINKGNNIIDSMYVSQWSDPDLGNATDDYAGCDTVDNASLGYVYNANSTDATYTPLPPPAVGFDFFQGPIVSSPGKTAIFKGQIVPDKENLPMTAFYYFARGDATVTDPTQGSYEGTEQFYNFFRGRVGRTGDIFTDPDGNQTTYTLAGDPVRRTGWLDGDLLPAGDRRIGLASGPFTMAVGDTQEVVVAELAAGALTGVDRITAITLLKYYDKQAQLAYDQFFNIIPPPPAPVVSTVEGDRSVALSWGDDLNAVQNTESYNTGGYTFQGYNVYQLPSATATRDVAKRVATFDLADDITTITDTDFDAVAGGFVTKPVQFGEDQGIRRFVNITQDAFKGTPLINGIKYYFAVTAYGFNPADGLFEQGKPRVKENTIRIITVVPHSTNPGIEYPSGVFGDYVQSTHSSGTSDGNVEPIIIDPNKLTGLSYKVWFDTLGGEIVWNMSRTNADGTIDTLLHNQTNQTGAQESPIIDGMQIRVLGPALQFKNFEVVANASGPLVPSEGGAADFGGFPSLRPTTAQQVSGQRWLFHTGDNGTRGDYASFLARTTRDGSLWPEIIPYDFEMRFTASGANGSNFDDGSRFSVPFEIWNIGSNTPTDASDDYQMIPYVLDIDGDGTYNLSSYGPDDHTVSGGDNDPYTDWVYWMRPQDASPGRAGYLAAEAELIAGTYTGARETEVMARTVLVAWNGGSAPPFDNPMPEAGTIFRLTSTKPNTLADTFMFVAPKANFNLAQAKEDIKKINVFPNPYYGVNTEELNKYQRFVTFTHLPEKATIRIFNLAGVLIKTIEKTSAGQFQRWDLANNSGLPVASGLYIAYIDMPGIGETKIIKLSIIQEQQILDRF